MRKLPCRHGIEHWLECPHCDVLDHKPTGTIKDVTRRIAASAAVVRGKDGAIDGIVRHGDDMIAQQAMGEIERSGFVLVKKDDAEEVCRLITEIASMEWSNGACANTSWFDIHIKEQTREATRCWNRIRTILKLPAKIYENDRSRYVGGKDGGRSSLRLSWRDTSGKLQRIGTETGEAM
jgi:hypothetical protein